MKYLLIFTTCLLIAAPAFATPQNHFYLPFDDGQIPTSVVKPAHADGAWQLSETDNKSPNYSLVPATVNNGQTVSLELQFNAVKGMFAFHYKQLVNSPYEFNITISGASRSVWPPSDGQWTHFQSWHLEGQNTLRLEAKLVGDNTPDLSLWLDNLAFFALEQDDDGDEMLDIWEHKHSLNFYSSDDALLDPDNDGLNNLGESKNYGDPHNPDTDGDGLKDGEEVHTYKTSPGDDDSDNDGMPDGWEVQHALDPTVNNGDEDIDGDGISNYNEYRAHTDPNDATSKPQVVSLQVNRFDDYQLPANWTQDDDDNGYWRVEKGSGVDGSVSLTPSHIEAGQTVALRWSGYFKKGRYSYQTRSIAKDARDHVFFWDVGNYGSGFGTNDEWRRAYFSLNEGYHDLALIFVKHKDSQVSNDRVWIDNLIYIEDGLDNDNDGIGDEYENIYGLDFTDPSDAAQDPDEDGLTNLEEFLANTNPTSPDSDGDELTDGDEVHLHLTNPRRSDTDGDQMDDGWEIRYDLDALSDTTDVDTDSDNYRDISEYWQDTDPTDPNSKPDGIGFLLESFENEALPAGWENASSQSLWTGAGNDATLDEGSLTATINNRQSEASVKWVGFFEKGHLNFDYKLTGGSLKVFIDHDSVLEVNTTQQWQTFSTELLDGEHTIYITYRYSNTDEGNSTAFIDNLRLFPNGHDVDNDGLPDQWELTHQLDYTDPTDASLDPDNDGLSNWQEYLLGSDINNADSDGDTLPDGYEAEHGMNALDPTDAMADNDGDGINNITEYLIGTNPADSTDANADQDQDGFSNLDEIQRGSDPLLKQSVPASISSWIGILIKRQRDKLQQQQKGSGQ